MFIIEYKLKNQFLFPLNDFIFILVIMCIFLQLVYREMDSTQDNVKLKMAALDRIEKTDV